MRRIAFAFAFAFAALTASAAFAEPLHLSSEETQKFDSSLVIDYSTSRNAWPGTTDPKRHDPRKFRYLISGTSGQSEWARKRMADPSLWEKMGISMSLVDEHHQESYTLAGYIFDVPKENVYVAGPADLGTANRNYETGNRDGFANDVNTAAEKAQELIAKATARPKMPALFDPNTSTDPILLKQWNQTWRENYKFGAKRPLASPETILKYTQQYNYNEIFVLGTSLDGKHKVKPIGVYITVEIDPSRNNAQTAITGAKVIEEINKLAHDRNLPVVHLYRIKGAPRLGPRCSDERTND